MRGMALSAATLLLCTALTACGGTESGGSTSTPTASPTAEAQADPPLTVALLLDASASFPPELRLEGIDAFARALESLVAPGFSGASISARNVTDFSRDVSSRIDTFAIPAVPVEPMRAANPAAPEPPDPRAPEFLFAKDDLARAQATFEGELAAFDEAVAAIEAEHEAAKADLEAAVSAATDAVEAMTATLRANDPPPAGASDIGGAIDKAAAVLAHAPGPKVLVFVSDLDPFGEQNFGELDLTGVDVRVISFWCVRSDRCTELIQLWEPLMSAAGAASITFVDPDDPFVTDVIFDREGS